MTKEEWLKIGEENGYNTSTTVTKPNWGGGCIIASQSYDQYKKYLINSDLNGSITKKNQTTWNFPIIALDRSEENSAFIS